MKRMFTEREIRSLADESAKIRIEAGQTENAKPLYYHGIEIYSAGTTFLITMAIIDNDPTAYTWTRLKQWIQGIDANVLINANGFYNPNSEGVTNLISIYHAKGSATLSVNGNDNSCDFVSTTKTFTEWDAILGAATMHDRVNKLN